MNILRVFILLTLMSFVVEAQKAINPSYPPDVTPSPKFRANRNSYSAIMDVLGPKRPAVTQKQLDRLKPLQFETIWGQLGEYKTNFVGGFQSTQKGKKLVGRAVTIRFLPPRPDLKAALETLAKEGDWPFGYYQRAAEDVGSGDVLVVDLGSQEDAVFMGDISAMGMMLQGAAGVVIDGATRDLAELSGKVFKDFPVFARYFHVSGSTWLGAEWNLPIQIGRATVLPGDVVVATDEGAIFFPPELIERVLERGYAQQADEQYERYLVKQKKYRFRDVYPPNAELRKKRKDYENRVRRD